MLLVMTGRHALGVEAKAPEARAQGGGRWRGALATLAVACAAVALASAPAGAQLLTTVSVAQPGSGASISDGGVVVEVRGLGSAEAAQARIVAAGQSRTVDLSGPDSFTGGSRWTGALDLSGLPNGPARVEGRAQLSGSMTEWSGHDVRLNVPAPAISLHVAPVAGHGNAVALSWTAAAAPDMIGYEVQRALQGSGYEGLLTAGAGQLAHTDVGLPPGDHRYRVRAVRAGGSGQPHPGPWAEGVAMLAPPPGVAGAAESGPGEATAGVAPAPPTGGISSRLRAGTEGMTLPEASALAPLVAPRGELPGPLAAPPEGAASAEELALGGGQPLSVGLEGPPFMGGDTVNLVALGLVGLFALRAHRLTHPKAPKGPGAPEPLRVRLSAGPGPGGSEKWRGAREWSRPAS